MLRVIERELQRSFADCASVVVSEPIDNCHMLFTANIERSCAQSDNEYQLGQVVYLLITFPGLSVISCASDNLLPSHYGSSGSADLRFHSPQPYTSLHCQTTDMGLMCGAVCLFTFVTHY